MTPLRTSHALLVLCLVTAAVGCANDLPRASDIKQMRVLGALTEVQGDPTRSSPRPGETADLTWSMVYPDREQDDSQLASLFISCTAPTQFSGQPVCQELIDAARTGKFVETFGGLSILSDPPDCRETPNKRFEFGPISLTCVTGTPHSVVKVVSTFKPAAMLVQGVICRNGAPKIDTNAPAGVSCDFQPGLKASERESIPVYGTVPIQHSDEAVNHNPSVDAATFRFGESELLWAAHTPEESALLSDDCAEAAQKQEVLSTNGKDESLTIEYDADARELHDGEPEALEFSTYITYGKLSRRFTVFPSDAKRPLKSTLSWDVSKELRDKLGEDSRLVRFFFTILDHHGGYALTVRELCVGRDLTRSKN